MKSEVIGLKGASGAFVFGAYSFCDKVAYGIILLLILVRLNFVVLN